MSDEDPEISWNYAGKLSWHSPTRKEAIFGILSLIGRMTQPIFLKSLFPTMNPHHATPFMTELP